MITWVKKLVCQPKSNWVTLAFSHLPPGGDTISIGNMPQKDIFKSKLLQKCVFWKAVLLVQVKLNYMENTPMDKIDKQPIWYNSKIQIQDNVIFYKTCVDAGIQYRKDLKDDRGTMLTYD